MIAPLLFLFVSCLGAALTAFAVLPSRRPGAISTAFFVGGLFFGELAAVQIGWQAAATIGFGSSRNRM